MAADEKVEIDTQKEKWQFDEDEMNEIFVKLKINDMRYVPLDSDREVPNLKPEWYDEVLFKKGQQLAKDYMLSTSLGQILGLITLLSFKNSIQPLIYTRKSDSIETAKSRYMSTAMIVRSWYKSDLWDKNSEGYKNIHKVRGYHINVSQRVNSLSKTDIENKCTLSSIINKDKILCPIVKEVKKDLNGLGAKYLNPITEHTTYFNQCEMSLTLLGFMGYIVAFPDKFGIPETEKEGLAGFAHLWRVIGHMLGVRDKYNICQGTFQEVKENCTNLIKFVIRPNMENLNEEWEHMSRCAVEGINKEIKLGFSFEELVLYLFWLVDLKMNNLMAKLSWTTKLRYYLLKCLVNYFYTFSLIRASINYNFKMLEIKYLKKINKNIL